MWFELRLRTRADVWVFTATITAIVVLVVTCWDYVCMSPEVFRQTRAGNTGISIFLAAMLSHYVGDKMRRLEELTRRLEHAVNHDHLTKVTTRMRFFQRCKQEAESLFPAVVLVLDIDHFKAVNDTHGHDGGDQALREVARLIARNCRSSDLVARFGGEEFLVLMPGASLADGLGAAERVRMRIAAAPTAFQNGRIGVTVSIGVAPVHTASEIDDAVRLADAALYRAKAGGRNRIEPAQQSPNASAELKASNVPARRRRGRPDRGGGLARSNG